MRTKTKSVLVAFAILLATPWLSAQTTRTVVSSLDAVWEIEASDDTTLYMTEIGGRVSRLHTGTGVRTTLLERVPGMNRFSEGGLLGMTLHENFRSNGFLYLSYTYRAGSNILVRVSRWTVSGDTLVHEETMIDGIVGSGVHNGCRLRSHNGFLYISTGDGARPPNAQNSELLAGKILRLRDDGSVPDDNQFGNAVWTIGHRNPQGLCVWPDGTIYSSEHGASTDDEVNVILKGRNYGWPDVEGQCDGPTEISFCETNNVVEPLIPSWTPTIAPGQITAYTSSRYPEWTNMLLMCAMKDKALYVIDPRSTPARQVRRIALPDLGRLRSICVTPSGRIYLGTTNRDQYGDSREGSDAVVELMGTLSSSDDDNGEPAIEVQGSSVMAQSSFVVTDAVGRIVHISSLGTGDNHTVDVSNLVNGFYMIVTRSAITGVMIHGGLVQGIELR